MKTTIKNVISGAEITHASDDRIMINLLTEDDEFWSKSDIHFEAFWLDDYIKTLQQIKDVLPNFKKDKVWWADRFKNNNS